MVDVVRDLNARYGRVYIAKKGKGGKKDKPLYVDQFYTDDNGNLLIRTVNRETGKHNDVLFNEDDYILDCPQVGMVSDGEKVFFLRRSPDRQWKGGYNNNVIHMSALSKREWREMSLKDCNHTSIPIVDFVYNPKYTTLAAGLKSMGAGKIFGFPLSRKFAVSLKDKVKYPVVYYKEWVVGWVQEGVIYLTENTHHLFEEISQYAACRRA